MDISISFTPRRRKILAVFQWFFFITFLLAPSVPVTLAATDMFGTAAIGTPGIIAPSDALTVDDTYAMALLDDTAESLIVEGFSEAPAPDPTTVLLIMKYHTAGGIVDDTVTLTYEVAGGPGVADSPPLIPSSPIDDLFIFDVSSHRAWTTADIATIHLGASIVPVGVGDGGTLHIDSLFVFVDSAPIAGGNTPPVASDVLIAPGSPTSSDDLVGTYTYFDADGDPETGSMYHWTRDGVLVPEFDGSTVVPAVSISRGETWTFSVVPSDGMDFGSEVTSPPVVIGNSPPVIDSFALSPATVHTNDLLSQVLSASDVDGDPISFVFDWEVNGVLRPGETESFIDLSVAGNGDKGDTITGSVTAFDGFAISAPTEGSVMVANTAPVLDAVGNYGVPEAVLLEIFLSATDDDSDPLLYSISGDALPGFDPVAGFDPATGHFSWTPPAGSAANYSVTFEVTDGTGVDAETIVITVGDVNAPPDLFAPESATVSEGDTLTFGLVGVDFDGDPITFGHTGLPLGATLDPMTGMFEWTPSFDQAGMYDITFTATSGDPPQSDTALTMIEVFDTPPPPPNTPPVVSDLFISPTDPGTDFELGANYTYFDADGDPEFGSEIHWFRNATLIPSLDGLLIVPIEETTKGDVWYFTYKPSDGIDFGEEITTSTVTIANSPPVIDSHFFMPGAPFTNDTLTQFVGGFDPDGDPVTFTFAWEVDGILLPDDTISLDLSVPGNGDRDNAVTGIAVVSDGTDPSAPDSIVAVVVDSPPVLDHVGNRVGTEGGSLEVQLTGSDQDGDVLTFSVSGDPMPGVTFDPSTGFFLSTPATGDAGLYFVTFGITDGTLSASEDIEIVIGTAGNTPPQALSISLSPGSPITTDDLVGSYTYSDVDGDLEDATAIYWYRNGGYESAFDGLLTVTADNTTKGETWFFTVEPFDGIDYGPLETSIEITIANSPPVITDHSLAPLPAFTNDTVTQTVMAEDADGDFIDILFGWVVNGLLLADDTASLDLSIPGNGDRDDAMNALTIAFDGTDASEVGDIAFVVSNSIPVLDPVGDKFGAEGVLMSFMLTGSDADLDTLLFSGATLPAGATVGPATGEFSWTPGFLQAGDHIVTFTVSDGTDSKSEMVTLHIADMPGPPVLDPVGDKIVLEDDTLLIDLSAVDPDGDPLTFDAVPLPPGATFDPATGFFSWTPSAVDIADHGITFSVTDGLFVDAESLTISVKDDVPPVFDSIPDKTVDENSLLTFTITATEANGETVSFSAFDLPPGATLDPVTGVFSWTPSFSQAGVYPDVTFIAHSGSPDQMDIESVSITVNNIDRAPVLDPTGSKSTTTGVNLAFTLTGLDPDGGAISFSAIGLPAGATLDGVSGVFSWTPPDAGTFPVTFRITSGEPALMDEEVITITVSAPPPPPGGGGGGGVVAGLPPPIISNIQADIDTNVTITWDTNESSTSIVDLATDADFQRTGTYTLSAGSGTLVTSNKVILTPTILQPNTLYHYRVVSADSFGNRTSSSNKTFLTETVVSSAVSGGPTTPAGESAPSSSVAETPSEGIAPVGAGSTEPVPNATSGVTSAESGGGGGAFTPSAGTEEETPEGTEVAVVVPEETPESNAFDASLLQASVLGSGEGGGSLGDYQKWLIGLAIALFLALVYSISQRRNKGRIHNQNR